MQRASSKVEQIIAQIRSLIGTQSFEGGRLPSEPSLAEMVGASRATVRQALAELEVEGLLIRKHGVGTFVNERMLNIGQRLDEVWDFLEMIEVAGHTPSIEHHFLTLGPTTPELAEKLGLQPEDEVITTANVFLADDVPVIYCIDYLPSRLVKQAYREEELQGPVYSFLTNRCETRIEYCIAELLPVVASDEIARLLRCDVGVPLQYVKEVGYDARDEPIIYSEEYYLPEFFNFTIVRKLTSGR